MASRGTASRRSGRSVRERGSNVDGDGLGHQALRYDAGMSNRERTLQGVKLVPSVQANLDSIKSASGDSIDVGVRKFVVGTGRVQAAAVYLDGMVDSRAVEELIEKLTIGAFFVKAKLTRGQTVYRAAREKLIPQKAVYEVSDVADLWSGIVAGNTAVLIDEVDMALVVDTRGWAARAINEPSAEATLRGPREGFVENLRTNISLIRRRIRTPRLKVTSMTIGTLTKTEVAYSYIQGLADDGVVEEVRSRLGKIDIDGILESGYIEEYIEDTPWTLFPLTERTEKPDRVAAALLEGRVAIFTDGTPFVLIVPTDLNALMQAPDDYYERSPIGSFIRSLRVIGFAASLVLPGTYVAVMDFHHELVPTVLFMRISAAREGVPFPTPVEVLLMELLFELLREAGVRLPRAVGPAISIVGALILGDAAIRAGIVSPPVVIVVGLTAISSFATPVFSLAIPARLLRFLFVGLGAFLGLFGVQFGVLVLLTHLSSLRSFGRPYLAPIAPLRLSDLKDTFVRAWWWAMVQRPRTAPRERRRQPSGQMPGVKKRS